MSMLRVRRALAAGLAVLMVLTTVPVGPVMAKMVTTDEVIGQSSLDADRERVRDFLLREDVREQLGLLGVDPDEAAERVANLTDAEVREIVGRLDELPAGEGTLGVVLGVALIIFVILLITDILGLTDVFPFVRR